MRSNTKRTSSTGPGNGRSISSKPSIPNGAIYTANLRDKDGRDKHGHDDDGNGHNESIGRHASRRNPHFFSTVHFCNTWRMRRAWPPNRPESALCPYTEGTGNTRFSACKSRISDISSVHGRYGRCSRRLRNVRRVPAIYQMLTAYCRITQAGAEHMPLTVGSENFLLSAQCVAYLRCGH